MIVDSFHAGVNCDTLSGITNGIISYSSGTAYESVAIYSCNTGYIIQGTSRRTCQADRTWDGSKPNCQSKTLILLVELVLDW